MAAIGMAAPSFFYLLAESTSKGFPMGNILASPPRTLPQQLKYKLYDEQRLHP